MSSDLLLYAIAKLFKTYAQPIVMSMAQLGNFCKFLGTNYNKKLPKYLVIVG